VSMECVRALVFVFSLKMGGLFGTVLTHFFHAKICFTVPLSILNSSVILMPK
jgi:hypothetical protein